MIPDTRTSTTAWYALHTKPKQEKRAFLNLAAWGLEAFVPWLCSSANCIAPLFPGYIFARFDVGQLLHKIVFTRGVSHVVSFGGVPAIVGEDVIASIRSRTDADGVARTLSNLKPGDMVVVQAGPLRNLVGVFERELPDTERIEILLTAIAYSARIKVQECQVVKLVGKVVA
jgi:transcriptional antiterminator RfaH